MRNWETLDADVVLLMDRHFTPGRGGRGVERVVMHHNAAVLTVEQVHRVWQDRPASAHYQVESGGRIGQLVWDDDTAWHAADPDVNQTSIGIEVSNSAGAEQDWPISDTAIEEAAHLAAAVCAHFDLSRPAAGTTIRWHSEFAATTCPYHLAPGGRYHETFMDRAGHWFDEMTGSTG